MAGESGFIADISRYPKAWALANELGALSGVIAAQGQQAIEQGLFRPWPEPINKGGWLVLGHKWQGKMLPGWENCTAGRIAAIGDLVLNSGYSLMMPGAEISPHVGYTGDVLRMHVGLSVPDGDCALVVGGESRKWQEGGVLFFNDCIEHSAHNHADKPRLVLLLDILRDKCLLETDVGQAA